MRHNFLSPMECVDYCTFSPDSFDGVRHTVCCFIHDDDYRRHLPKRESDRKLRDNIVKVYKAHGKPTVGKIVGDTYLAFLMNPLSRLFWMGYFLWADTRDETFQIRSDDWYALRRDYGHDLQRMTVTTSELIPIAQGMIDLGNRMGLENVHRILDRRVVGRGRRIKQVASVLMRGVSPEKAIYKKLRKAIR